MSERTLDDVVEDLKKITGDKGALVIYLPNGESKTNSYANAFTCLKCGSNVKKSPNMFDSQCGECGHWNYQWDMVTTIC